MVIEVRQSYSQYNSPSCAHAMIPTFVCVLKSTFRRFQASFNVAKMRAKLHRSSDTKIPNDESVEISVENRICGVEWHNDDSRHCQKGMHHTGMACVLSDLMTMTSDIQTFEMHTDKYVSICLTINIQYRLPEIMTYAFQVLSLFAWTCCQSWGVAAVVGLGTWVVGIDSKPINTRRRVHARAFGQCRPQVWKLGGTGNQSIDAFCLSNHDRGGAKHAGDAQFYSELPHLLTPAVSIWEQSTVVVEKLCLE